MIFRSLAVAGFLPMIVSCNPLVGTLPLDDGYHAGVNYSLDRSSVRVSASNLVSGSSITVTLTLYDTNGNPYTSPETVVFSAQGASGAGAFSTVAHPNNGNAWTATFTGTVAGGPLSIAATVNGQTLTSAFPTVMIDSGNSRNYADTSVQSSGSASSASTKLSHVSVTSNMNNMTATSSAHFTFHGGLYVF